MKRILALITASFIILFSHTGLTTHAATAVPDAVLTASKSVVRIYSEGSESITSGSGFVVFSDNQNTYIATNWHVVENDPHDIMVWVGSDETIAASVYASSPTKDLCILKLSYPVSIPALPLKTELAAQGDAVYAVGFPAAADTLSDTEAHTSNEATITDGIVSAIRSVSIAEYAPSVTLLQVNAAINSGNSGGPLFDVEGNVIGVNTYGAYDSQGIFGAIAATELAGFLIDNGISPVSTARSPFPWWALAGGIVVIAGVTGALLLRKKRQKKAAPGTSRPLPEVLADRQAPYSSDEAASIMFPLACKLRDLHNNGHFHHEIAPDTILIDGKGTAVLLPPSGSEVNRYRTGFAAPEIYSAEGCGKAADIYSFCAILYYLTTLVKPENALSRSQAQKDESFSREERNQDDFQKILRKGMALHAGERYADMQELIALLAPYSVGISAQQSNETGRDQIALQRAVSHPKKKLPRKGVIGIAAASLAVLAIGAYSFYYMKSVSLAEEGQFQEAGQYIFTPVLNLHDQQLVPYLAAGKLLADRQFEAASEAFTVLGEYRSAQELALEARYRQAMKLADGADFEASLLILEELAAQNYADSAARILDVRYQDAAYQLYERGEFAIAYARFQKLSEEGYEKADQMCLETELLWAYSLIEQERYYGALEKLKALQGYSDADEALAALTDLILLTDNRNMQREIMSERGKHLS